MQDLSQNQRGVSSKSILTPVLEPQADGTLHLPLPPELGRGKFKVEAKVEALVEPVPRAKAGLWKGLPDRFWMAPDFDAPLDDFREYME